MCAQWRRRTKPRVRCIFEFCLRIGRNRERNEKRKSEFVASPTILLEETMLPIAFRYCVFCFIRPQILCFIRFFLWIFFFCTGELFVVVATLNHYTHTCTAHTHTSNAIESDGVDEKHVCNFLENDTPKSSILLFFRLLHKLLLEYEFGKIIKNLILIVFRAIVANYVVM